jgi:UDP-N-acetylglucosamine 4,6-dehydratase
LRAALDCKVKKVIVISSDKAPSPANLYGATKMCAERIAIAANAYTSGLSPRPIFSVVRYGNVAGSTGSVVSVFRKQFAEQGQVFLTDERMTRFWWTAKQAVAWTSSVAEIMEPGCLYVPLIPSVKIIDIARYIAGNRIAIVGMRNGEKIHETMLTEDEMSKAEPRNGMYVIRPDAKEWTVRVSYNSRDNSNWLSGEEAVKLAEVE